ncbi:thermonuclease family protein [Patescibacteria group bacterium]|nr:site-specific DNA-methyltransferase [Candidatus Falkowbacteria bacterium]MBU3905638.1 thermonuclease family protein [Patescibacteria group bacterium]MBU4015508.1 thermonuclease family protein [Patescibacteria group bacterium]MBU4026532.1 thermonuclease family protein [Patescibacteria group bacterium]MBU4073170.1 thermonuclease family protein [Patescibacteria group bacterium]
MTTNNIKTNHKIIRGDSRRMKELADNSTHLVITSPPYWQLKDYGTTNQIGYHDSYENYINNLNLVWQECFRVLENGCRLCINIGDQFARSVYYGRYKVIPIRTEIIKFCETIGFDYMGSVIWQKSTTMNTTGGATIMGSFPYPRNGIIKLDYEFILIFKKNGEPQKLNKELKELSKLTKEEWNLYFQGHWRFNGVRQDDHIAMFPEELPKRLIKMFSFVGDTIIDPFMGSGTTSLAAKNLGRNSVGYEINPKFIDIIKQKLEVNVNKMFDNSTVDFMDQGNTKSDYSEEISKLLYIFKDPIKLDKKIDPKKLQFGSKIDDSKAQRIVFFTIKEIIDPKTIKLNNDLVVKLLGIKINPEKSEDAKNYLLNKTNKQKVFLRFDNLKYDKENNLLCYLYLQNKTFINAHLIKEGYVFVNNEMDYKCKEKFINLSQNNYEK